MMRNGIRRTLAWGWGLWILALGLRAAPRPALESGFEQQVRPVLQKYCNDCHDASTRKA